MPFYRAELGGKTYTEGDGIDITSDVISLESASTSQFGGIKIDDDTIGINSNNQIYTRLKQTITLSDNTSSIAVGSTDTITVSTDGGGTISVSSSNNSVATASVSGNEIMITGVGTGSCVITVTAGATSTYGGATSTITVTSKVLSVFGVEWDGSSDPTWTRTDDSADFEDPNPYYAGMTETPSSPFDNISPWKDIRIVEDANAGTLVEIPKFYYKWTRSGNTMKLQITSDVTIATENNFYVSPAHTDRGDGVGERDYVYVGRYHCTSDYKSKTGVVPRDNTSLSTFKSNIRNLGSNIYMYDYAMWWTVGILYLVEYANWNACNKIGVGGGPNDNTLGIMGYTDSMPYHTGTILTSRSSEGFCTQYRNIEGWWDNVRDWIDGLYILQNYPSYYVYMIKNPSDYYYLNNGTIITTIAKNYGTIIKWGSNPSRSGFEYAIFPSNTDNNASGYICSWYNPPIADSSNNSYLLSGRGSFFTIYGTRDTNAANQYGARLMVLPPSRLSST